MSDTTLIHGANVDINPDSSWVVKGVGDFNADGKAELLWQKTAGTPAIWIMNGTSFASSSNLANPGSTWARADDDGLSGVF